MTKKEFEDRLANRIGWQVINCFRLEENQTEGNLISTRWGAMTPKDIGETILSIVRDETSQTEKDLQQ